MIEPTDSSGTSIIPLILNGVVVLLPIIATIVVLGRVRGSRLAVWLLVIWFLPIIGPLVAFFRSKEPSSPLA